MSSNEYTFVNDGIGSVLKQSLLKVPPNQRPYAWEEEHVRELLDDIKEAMNDESDVYFLGTVVLVESEQGRKLIADGQQRIATASIILARCRDLLREFDEDEDAKSIEKDFLKRYVRRSRDYEHLLTLNVEDLRFFQDVIIEPNWRAARPKMPSKSYPSNQRLYAASKTAMDYLKGEIAHLSPSLAVEQLNRWASYFEDKASVVAVTVPDEVGAFRMFETLNDRGLRASQADILKNYFFSRAGMNALDHVQAQWNQMYGALADRFENADEQMLKYIKYYWTLQNGLTRDRELANNIKKKIKSSKQSSVFVTDANSAVADYIAIFNTQDPKWRQYGADAKADLSVLTDVIDIEQIVPLVFAVAHKFSVVEARKALKLFVSWSVRFMLGGSGRAGRLDKQYADLALEVGSGRIKTTRELRDFLADKVPGDDAFERAVRDAKVSNPVLARYYLICFEKASRAGSGELEPSKDVAKVNLEHVLPKAFANELGVTRADHQDLITRLGNQTVMQSEWNRDLGNQSFAKKRKAYKKSEIQLTKKLADFRTFKREQIDERQKQMARLAPSIWTLKFGG